MPDGLTVVSQFGLDGTLFPKQFEDISYGIEQVVGTTALISSGDSARWIVPTDDSLDSGPISWIDPDFVDDTWQSGITGIGFASSSAGGEISLPQIDGLRANFAADGTVYTQGTTPATDGQSVQTWVDPAGVADNATQSQSGSRPIWIAAGIDVGGGLFRPVVRFGGSFLEMNSVADVLSGTDQAMTVVAVAKFNGTARRTLTGFGNSTSTTPLHQIRPTSIAEGDQYFMQRRDNGSVLKDARGGSVGRPASNFELLMAIDTGTQGSMFVDGVAVFENQNLDVGQMSLDQAAIGALPLGANRFDQLDGDIAELLIFDRALTAAEQSLVGEYLAAKYALDTTYGEFTPVSPIVDLVETDVQSAMLDVSASLYMRQEFSLNAGETLSALSMRVKYNDGFVAYLNGQEVARRNAPASPDFASTATSEHSPADSIVFEEIDLMAPLDKLRGGANVLAIRGLNLTADDDDFLIITELIGEFTAASGAVSYFTKSTPGGVNQFPGVDGFVGDTNFSVDRGFFETPFFVQITSTSSDAEIYYTTNGSAPSPQNSAASARPNNSMRLANCWILSSLPITSSTSFS